MKITVFLFLAVCLATIAISSANTKPHVVTTHQGASGAAGGTKGGKGKTYEEHKAVETGEKTSKHDKASTKKGHKSSELHRTEDLEQGGKKHKHGHSDKHSSSHHGGGGDSHGAKFGEASKKSKANYKKGFREQFHKDELKNHDSFYSNGEKSGTYNIFGQQGSKYGSESGAKLAGGSFKSLKSEGKHGKASKKANGHHKAEKKAHKSAKAAKSSYAKGGKYAKKGGKKGGKQYKQHSTSQ